MAIGPGAALLHPACGRQPPFDRALAAAAAHHVSASPLPPQALKPEYAKLAEAVKDLKDVMIAKVGADAD